MSRSAAPARVNNAGTQARINNNWARTNAQTRTHAQTRANITNSRANLAATTGTGNLATTAALNTTRGMANGVSPNTYTYGYGNGARRYQAYGYGNGYRNRRYGSGYGYGRSQGNNRAVVSRLRSVHASLARIDHDYQGHRVRAMHAISMAIRQLSQSVDELQRDGCFVAYEQRPGHGDGHATRLVAAAANAELAGVSPCLRPNPTPG